MQSCELLQRIASTLRQDVGPAVTVEYPKTQAFMAAVVLQKIGRELELAEQHRAEEAADLQSLRTDLRAMVEVLGAAPSSSAASPGFSAAVRDAIDRVAVDGDAAALCDLIQVLYAERSPANHKDCDALLARVRVMLRAQIDRRMEVAV